MSRKPRTKIYRIRILTDKWEEKTIDNRDIAIDTAIQAVMFYSARRSQVLLDSKFIACYKSGIDYTERRLNDEK